jgi:hypothetical protein
VSIAVILPFDFVTERVMVPKRYGNEPLDWVTVPDDEEFADPLDELADELLPLELLPVELLEEDELELADPELLEVLEPLEVPLELEPVDAEPDELELAFGLALGAAEAAAVLCGAAPAALELPVEPGVTVVVPEPIGVPAPMAVPLPKVETWAEAPAT